MKKVIEIKVRISTFQEILNQRILTDRERIKVEGRIKALKWVIERR